MRMGRELEDRKLSLARQLDEVNDSLSRLWTEYGDMHNSGIYINRIPTEVLCQIFSMALNFPKLAGDGYYVFEEDRPSTEVALSHVCQHWRRIALDDPSLWRSFRYKTPRWKRDPLSRFTTYLNRSSPMSIDLFIHFNLSSHEDMILLNAAALQVHRWRRVTIISEDNKFNWSNFQSALQGRAAPALEYFSFRPSLFVASHVNSGHISPVTHLTPQIFTGGAPKLTHIHLDSTVPYFFLPPLSNVTTFSLDAKYIGPSSMTWNAFLEILALPRLTSLSIGGEVLLGPTEEHLHQPIESHSLRHLRWSGDPDRLEHFLSYLSAPNLETLILCRMYLPPRPTRPDASTFLPSLRSLHIIECNNLTSHYIEFLAAASPNVTSLAMSYYRPESAHLLSYLNRESAEGRTHWTKLENIATYVDGVDSAQAYLDLMRPRKREGVPLTLRVSNRLYLSWIKQMPQAFCELREMCYVVPWTRTSDILPSQWPPGSSHPVMQHDRSSQFNFAVDWNEF